MISERATRTGIWRRAALAFLGICIAVIVFPVIVNMTAQYYFNHPVVIPVGERLLMAVGALVRLFRWPIIAFVGIGLTAISLAKAR